MTAPKIVIIDDDASLTRMLEVHFERDGYIPLVVHNGEDGLQVVKRERPQIIILDIMLPQMDGYAVLKILKEDKKTANIPVILLTALGWEDDIQKGINLGAEHYLIKPIRMAVLFKCIETSLKESLGRSAD